MPDGFEVRGVIEGFYGDPWSHEARLTVISLLAPQGMNAYIYGPKDDPFHRERWREPYPAAAQAELVELVGRCRQAGVRFGFALSPGLDIDYTSAADRDAVWAKLAPLVEAGADWIVLAFDDVPHRDGAAKGQADLTGWVLERLRAASASARVSVVPTDYVGTIPTPYLDDLCPALPDEVDLFWTGRTVVSPTITVEEADARAGATGGRRPLLWDNYPVNDGFMAPSLHLGPLVGRDAGLAGTTAGMLANPMPQARASLVALMTVMQFLRDPAGYDPRAAWEEALALVTDELEAPWLGGLAGALCTSALHGSARNPLMRAVEAGDLAEARAIVEAAQTAARAQASANPLWDEVAAWALQVRKEAAAALSALDILDAEPQADGQDAVLRGLGFAARWGAARAGGLVAFGPRFACVPAIVQRGADVGIEATGLVVEDASAVDHLCRLALAHLGGPLERAVQGPSGPAERGVQGPSGPAERGVQGPSGPAERETQ